MARYHPPECKVCGARATHVHISARGKCPDHSMMRMHDNVVSLRTKRGPGYERWLRGLARGIVAASRKLDDAREQT